MTSFRIRYPAAYGVGGDFPQIGNQKKRGKKQKQFMLKCEFIKEIIGEEVLDRYIELKEIELRENLNANDKEMVKRKYFEYI